MLFGSSLRTSDLNNVIIGLCHGANSIPTQSSSRTKYVEHSAEVSASQSMNGMQMKKAKHFGLLFSTNATDAPLGLRDRHSGGAL
jgi:hypothetical protein